MNTTTETEFTELGEEITVDGFTLTARVERDDSMGEPWKEHDGHGPVSDWTRRDKRPGERVLCEDHGSKRYYDAQEAIKIAVKDGWGCGVHPGGETCAFAKTQHRTHRECAACAVEQDFKRMRDWCRDEWWWVGVVVSVAKNGVTLDENAANLWGIESDAGDYLVTVANELVGEAVEVGRGVVETINS